jgi:hypothetical protein
MKSRKLMRMVLRQGNAKQVAADLHVSVSTVYKWSEEGESGRRNPLELSAELFHSTRDRRLVEWLCAEAGGYFVRNPPAKGLPQRDRLQARCQAMEMLGQFQSALARSLPVNGSEREAALQELWAALKSDLERCVGSSLRNPSICRQGRARTWSRGHYGTASR